MNPKKRRGTKEDPVVQMGLILTLLGFLIFYSGLTSVNLSEVLGGIVGMLVGLLLVLERRNPEMANRILDLLLEIFKTLYEKIIGLIFREKESKKDKESEELKSNHKN